MFVTTASVAAIVVVVVHGVVCVLIVVVIPILLFHCADMFFSLIREEGRSGRGTRNKAMESGLNF